MKKFIVFYGGLLGILIVTALLAGIQFAIYQETKSNPKVATDVTCVVQDTIITDGGNKVALDLNCQGQKAILKDPKVVVRYLHNPRPLTCTVYKSGKVKCQLLEQ